MTFSQMLENLMNENKITAYRLSKEIGVHQTSIKNWTTGLTKPNEDKLRAISDYFDVTVDYLLGNTDTKNAPSEDEVVSDELIQFALFGGKVDDESYEEVKKFAAYVKARKAEEKKNKK